MKMNIQCHHIDNSPYILIQIPASSKKTSGISSSMIQEISNGICRFSPTSRKGKWIFLVQTICLSFSPIILLIIQNSFTFNDMMNWKNEIITKDLQVREARRLSNFIINLQLERQSVLKKEVIPGGAPYEMTS